MSRRLDDLEPVFRARCFELIARCAEAGLPVMIIDTLRSAKQQADNVARGASWVAHSKHEDGLAIDLCPYVFWKLHGPNKLNWDADSDQWRIMGQIGVELGLVWGGNWKQRDMGHFEAPEFKA